MSSFWLLSTEWFNTTICLFSTKKKKLLFVVYVQFFSLSPPPPIAIADFAVTYFCIQNDGHFFPLSLRFKSHIHDIVSELTEHSAERTNDSSPHDRSVRSTFAYASLFSFSFFRFGLLFSVRPDKPESVHNWIGLQSFMKYSWFWLRRHTSRRLYFNLQQR